jgi:hypothetical protein
MTNGQEQKSPEEAGQEEAQVVGDRQEQATEGRFSKEPEGGIDEKDDDERREGPPGPQEQTEAKLGEESKEDLQDTQEEAKAKFGEAQGKLPGRPLSAAAVAAVAVALLLLLLLRRRRG